MLKETTYERWLQQEGLPVVRGHGVTDVHALELQPWKRLGGRGAAIQLQGMEGFTGMYVGEIPPGGALEPEKHVYDELYYILSGRGVTEVWNDKTAGAKHFFEWQTGSLFAPPLNTWHRLLNGAGNEPVRFLGFTSAPIVMDLFHNTDFVFNCRHRFKDRFDGRPNYFEVGERRRAATSWGSVSVWETNFIPDVQGASLERSETKASGLHATNYEIAGNVLVGHMVEWPVGRYHKAHYHGGGAVLLIVRSEGYSLMWPRELGTQPYQSGHGDQVVRVDWQPGSVFSPSTGWFHQHFNTGPVPARQLAVRYGSHNYPMQFWDIQSGEGSLLSLQKGGSMIEYEDEDPEIRRQFKQELARVGVEYTMPELQGAASG
jgi:mannose-6-phosphate isomerase-like protein (cupin superfamily)